MLFLPLFNAKLAPCPVSPAEFTPHPQGNFCGQCQRVVHDFSQSTTPRADLAAARAAAPDGRVCGTFGRTQLEPPAVPKLSRRLRWFVAALVLVVAQGLSAREALAQVRRAVPHWSGNVQKKQNPVGKKGHISKAESIKEQDIPESGVILMPTDIIGRNEPAVYTFAEVMPTIQGKSYPEVVAYIQQRVVQWPKGTGRVDTEGRVFISFTVDTGGQVRDARILKGLHPLLDAEALRVIQTLPIFTPGRQNGKPVPVSLTVPIAFKRN